MTNHLEIPVETDAIAAGEVACPACGARHDWVRTACNKTLLPPVPSPTNGISLELWKDAVRQVVREELERHDREKAAHAARVEAAGMHR